MPPTNNINTYCDYSKHEYYNRQGDICTSCDRCPLGLGLSSIEERKFDIDPVYGALGCQHCVPCPKGFYSEQYTYEKCQPCTDCVKEGRSENFQCNPKQNAVCGNFLQNRSSSHGLPAETIYLIIGVCFVVILAAIIVFFVYRHLKKKRIRRQSESRNPTESDESTRNLLSSSSSTMGQSQDSSDLATDCVPDTDRERSCKDIIEQWKHNHASALNAELSDRHARMISTSIAGASAITDIGLNLGLTDSSIKIIQENNTKDVREQAYETLIKWKQTKAPHATVSKFLEVLLRLEFHNMAKEFCEKYDELESSS